nr:SDR family NAD(P)-dependent oxidoreductase [Clostridioides difficile]
MEKLQGKIAVVTAATKGIGLASAEILAKNGATVYLAARSEELANEVYK